MNELSQRSGLLNAYLFAKEYVIRAGYSSEIDWQDNLRFEDSTEQKFLREVAWVILCSGMREQVVRKHFSKISLAFCNWESAEQICKRRLLCRRRALTVFGHRQKIDAIIGAAELIFSRGYESLKSEVEISGIQTLRRIPFIGPVTVYHLAKNLGLDVAKPDRHLCRIASALDFESPDDLCKVVASEVGDRISTIDLILWRFATLRQDYCSTIQREYLHEFSRRKPSRQVLVHRGKCK